MRRNNSSRKDIKLGIVFSMAVILVVGGYYVIRGTKEVPIPVSESAAKPNATPAKNGPATTAPNASVGNNKLANGARNGTPGAPSASNPNRPNQPNQPAPPAVNPTPNGVAANPPVSQPNPNQVASRNPVLPQPSSPNPSGASPTSPSPVKPEPTSSLTGGPMSRSVPSPAPSDRMANANSPAAPSPVAPSPVVSPGAGNQLANLENRTAPPVSPAADTKPAAIGPVASNDAAKGFDLAKKPDPTATSPNTNNASKSLTAMPPMLPPSTANPAAKGPSAADANSAAVDTHRVQQGDTFISLAKSYYGSSRYAKFLRDANPAIPDGAQLTPGVAIKIPPLPNDVDKVPTKEAAAPKSDSASAKNAVVTKGGKRTYTARSGDSLYKIAKDQLGSSNRWKDVFELNKAALHNDPTQLRVGQTIVLPET